MEALREFYTHWHWYVQSSIVLFVLGVCFWVGFRLSRRTYWRTAFREIFQRTSIVICFGMLCLYTLIAVLDSVGYHPYLRDRDGTALKHPDTGATLYDHDGISLLDVILKPLRDSKEKTYSAPMASQLHAKEAITREDGSTVRDYPPLKNPRKHLMGTDRVGIDVLYLGIKGVRTGMVIGAFTTLMVIPFAILFGVVAGYFGGWVDDVIQYIYTVLSSIPAVLLIVAFMIIFGKGLPQLCIILGITSWTGLCRVLRGETMKLRETEFVQAAEAMGVSRLKIMVRHLVPNVMHIVLITAVLSFSGRVLAEAVLTYIGIGVGADTISWGAMITDASLEMARDPVIWWKLGAAFLFMLGLVLPANLFGDALRDALDPRLRTQ